jgi:hypothetical protein
LFVFDSILLVREREGGTLDSGNKLFVGECESVFVMQRCIEGGIVDSSMNCEAEGDITETKASLEKRYSAGWSNQKKATTMSWMVCCWR